MLFTVSFFFLLNFKGIFFIYSFASKMEFSLSQASPNLYSFKYIEAVIVVAFHGIMCMTAKKAKEHKTRFLFFSAIKNGRF